MFTESSNPTMAKKASDVAVVTARNTLLSPGVSKATTAAKSALPCTMTHIPTRITSSRPVSSIRVSTTLALTLSPTPRKLIAATSSMKPSAATSSTAEPVTMLSRPSPAPKFAAKAIDAVDAEVMPDDITVKQTMNVRKWMPNALCV